MALGFLAAASLASTGMGMLQAFRGRDEPEGLAQQRQSLADATTYGRAAINPESPHFRAVSALDEAQRKRDIVQVMNEIMKVQNRARARGVVGPLTNPERRDETIASIIADRFARTGDQSRQHAQGALQGAAAGARGTAAGYQGPVQTSANVEGANFGDRMAGIESIPDFASALQGFLGKGYNQDYGVEA